MVYQVLARKWRPCDFSEVVGQSATVTILQNSLDSQKLHHAYLFTGTRGVGKTTIARILAKSLICERGISSKPCNVCDLCCAVTEGSCLDVIEIDAASRTKVEDTRAILDNLAYAPNNARFKVYIIDEVHMLSNHSFNALLKSLEEPPPHVKFLLATTDPQKLPITVLSRCLQFKLKIFTIEAIAAQLDKILSVEDKLFEYDAILQIASAANGSMRDSLSLLEQVLAFAENNDQITLADVCKVLGMPDANKIIDLIKSIILTDLETTMRIVNSFFEDHIDFSIILQEIQRVLKNIAILQFSPKSLAQDLIFNKNLLLELANLTSKEEIQLYYEIAVIGFKNLAFMPDPKVGFEMIMLRMIAFKPMSLSASGQIMPSLLYVKNNSDINLNINVDNAVYKSNIKNNENKILLNNNLNMEQTKSHEFSMLADNQPPSNSLIDLNKNNKNNDLINCKDSNTNNLDFINIMPKLNISGLTKQLSEVSVFQFFDDYIKLIVDQNNKILITKNNIENLQTAFSKYFSKEIKIKVEIIDFYNHPDLNQQTIKWQVQQKKQNLINQDNNLQQFIASFDAQIEEISEECE
jgi:DNA polymerase-3 subunit gamma/tau